MVSCAGGPNSPCSDFWEGQPYFLGHVRTLSVIKPACGVESQVGQCDLFKEMRFRGFRAFRIHLMHWYYESSLDWLRNPWKCVDTRCSLHVVRQSLVPKRYQDLPSKWSRTGATNKAKRNQHSKSTADFTKPRFLKLSECSELTRWLKMTTEPNCFVTPVCENQLVLTQSIIGSDE